jgi:hypothetical protein
LTGRGALGVNAGVRLYRCLFAVAFFGLSLGPPAAAGEIPGIPGQLPSAMERRFELAFSNDFLGRGGSVDDFRTQQLGLVFVPADRWVVALDHSILTLTDVSEPGRIDQLAVSVGREIFDSATSDMRTRVSLGGGLRAHGDFAGERMQNGFHRLLGSKVEDLPYTTTDDVSLTAWVDAQRRTLRSLKSPSSPWRVGYSLRASSLLSSDGAWDSTVGAYAVANRGSFDAWLGLRKDWRSGYDEPVLRETANAESDLALALGLRWGPLILETVQQFDNDASYGQLRLVSPSQAGRRPPRSEAGIGVELAFELPDVMMHTVVRYRPTMLNRSTSDWRHALLLRVAFGEPQYGDDTTLFTETLSVAGGWEAERDAGASGSLYGGVAVGARRERLVGDGDRLGQRSNATTEPGVSLSVGWRLHAASLSERWDNRLQLGFSAWLPLSGESVTIENEALPIQEPTFGLLLGMSLDGG